MTPYGLPPPEVWLYEGKDGGFYINNDQSSEIRFANSKERETWLSNFPDMIRHKGKPPDVKWWGTAKSPPLT